MTPTPSEERDGLVEQLANGGHTPGPWGWFGNANSYSLYLATRHSGRRYVMSFRRWGMRGAQPEFQPARGGLVDASRLLEFEVGDRAVRGVEQAKADSSVYRYDVRGIDCPDARLIAAAPQLLDIAIAQAAEITRLRAEVARKDEALDECQAALAMVIAPEAIKNTTVAHAFATATAAEAKARAARMPAEGRAALEQESG